MIWVFCPFQWWVSKKKFGGWGGWVGWAPSKFILDFLTKLQRWQCELHMFDLTRVVSVLTEVCWASYWRLYRCCGAVCLRRSYSWLRCPWMNSNSLWRTPAPSSMGYSPFSLSSEPRFDVKTPRHVTSKQARKVAPDTEQWKEKLLLHSPVLISVRYKMTCELTNYGPTYSVGGRSNTGRSSCIAGQASSLFCNVLQNVCQSLCLSCMM